ncbi:transmembrane transport protein [Streptomyces bingchenggensis BCW-1]|uniref:Transmembrane transport protein n=1 Tax=Streptomyces bingchenggensis (strain BCW-1) TaxID=749414 RepID=D7CGJ0_STRBB|nr:MULTISPECIES: translation initiation factor IF-2 [Streptomyces]ADI11070.1 transmembrane transport protein [Streptomyces bingchenggensis BCW-1]
MSTAGLRLAGPVARPRTRGLVWLVWRQHRAALWAGLALVVAVAAYILWQRAQMVGYMRAHDIDGCADWQDFCHGKRTAPRRGTDPITDAYFHLRDAYRTPLLNTGRLLIALPALIGVFVGAPLFARELETGTHQLVWTQSVSRTRWLAAKLALPLAAVLTGTTVLAVLYTWWWRAARVQFSDIAWGTAVPFDATGPAAVALAPLSFFLGAAAGLLLRRTLPAMVATLGITVGVQYGLGALRPHLMTPRTIVSDATGAFARTPSELFYTSWRGFTEGFLTRSGEKVPSDRCSSAVGDDDWNRCLARLGATKRQYEELHPASHFWPMQWIQAGICLAAAAALAALCVWWIGHRPAAKEAT